MKICVIGGSGFVGTRLINLIVNNFEVKSIDKTQSPFHPEITSICNIMDLNQLKSELKGVEFVVHLAAEHKDNVNPISLYYDINVSGTRNVLEAMDYNGIKNIIFTSSVAVYGLNKDNPTEEHVKDPFNHYGKSKLEAEEILLNWYNDNPNSKRLFIIRPTVIFGERNRGNVYNLLRQIAIGRFLKIGSGNNKKSMAYVGNVVAFIHFLLNKEQKGSYIFNYVDSPDFTMNEFVDVVLTTMKRRPMNIGVPYWIGVLGGITFDLVSKISKREFPISAVRVKKFCATTQFNAAKAHSSGFVPPYTLHEGIERTLQFEFINEKKDEIIFETE